MGLSANYLTAADVELRIGELIHYIEKSKIELSLRKQIAKRINKWNAFKISGKQLLIELEQYKGIIDERTM